MTEFLFLDLDDTILDFHKAERIALSKTLTEFGVEPAEEVLSLYHRINLWHWAQLEKGKLTRDEVQVGRFAALLRELGVSADAVQMYPQLRRQSRCRTLFPPRRRGSGSQPEPKIPSVSRQQRHCIRSGRQTDQRQPVPLL
ncbi:MAG: hypothetical protein V8T48_04625 [Oscillospiraceae bacterium]